MAPFPHPGTLLAVLHLNATKDVLLALAGVAAGIINGVAGGGTLVTFPALLAMGTPALTANMTSTVGIWPGYLGGVAGFWREIADQRADVWRATPVVLVGAVAGSVLLLTTPAGDFEQAAPWLVLVASLLFAAQPLLRRWLARVESDHPTRRVLLFGGLFLTSVYGGYFGAGMGVVFLAVLGLALPDTLARSSGLRTILSVLVNGVAALIFVVHGTIVWSAAGLIAAGALVGGWIGARLALRLPVPLFRGAVIMIGLATAIRLLVG